MSMLAELVELVIGVDTHADTHAAVLVAVDTRAVLASTTVTTDEDGYAELVALAEEHSGLRGGRSRAPVVTVLAIVPSSLPGVGQVEHRGDGDGWR
jgi:hypothetical protein